MYFKKESVRAHEMKAYVIGSYWPALVPSLFVIFPGLQHRFLRQSTIQQVFIKCLVPTAGGMKPPKLGPSRKQSILWVLEKQRAK